MTEIEIVENGSSDHELMLAIERGSKEAFDELYARHKGMLRGLAMRILYNESDADEVLQDVFGYIWAHASEYSPERGNLAGWIVTLCRRRAIDRLRKSIAYARIMKAFAKSADSLVGTTQAWRDQDGNESRLRSLVEEALQRLRSKDAKAASAFWLHDLEGLSLEAVGEKLNCSENAVKQIRKRWKPFLAKALCEAFADSYQNRNR